MNSLEEINMRSVKNILTIIIFYFIVDIIGNKNDKSLIYILIWATRGYYMGRASFLDEEKGQQYFINKKCRFQNCFLTDNKTYFSDVRDFDVILFNVMILKDQQIILPSHRSENQKYVFISTEPPAFHPIRQRYNGFFNLTWTYKLDSDAFFRYLVVKNKYGELIGPRKKINWIDINDMEPINNNIKQKLQTKNIAAVWLASHCPTPSQREEYVAMLMVELHKYNLHIDVFGDCGYNNVKQCPKGRGKECPNLIESDYYFYLAFENSMSQDYVTEKLLTATKHFTVPIVYGGADYTR